VESTAVWFRELSEEEIGVYVAGGEPMDKAGAYAIQGGARGMVVGWEGSYTNVVGLPMERVVAVLGKPGQRTTERR
jgi:septum formation protein